MEYFITETALGTLCCALADGRIESISFLEGEAETAELRVADGKLARLVDAPAWFTLENLAVGGNSGGIPNMRLSGSTFRLRVWEAVRRIPAGETATYGEIAEAIGQPKAVRAVASAVAANKVAVLIPCHRIVRSGGAPGRYRWGASRKKSLLAYEKSLTGK